MNKNQKIGLAFALIGMLIIPLFYFIASDRGFVLAVLIGLMAIVFGGVQWLLAKPKTTRTSKATKLRKTSRRH